MTDMSSSTSPAPEGRASRRAGGGREARRAARARPQGTFPAYMTRAIKPWEVLNEEALVIIENNAEKILQEIGLEFRDDPEIIEIWKNAGADIQGERVRFPKGMCRKLIQDNAPSQFTMQARDPARDVIMGGDHTVLSPAYGSPFVRDLDGGRRYATLKDFENFVKLTHSTPWLHFSGGTVCEPVDLPVPKRHLEMVYSHLRYGAKPFMGSVTAPERAIDSLNMTKIAFGDRYEQGAAEGKPSVMGFISINSPLVMDATMLGAMKEYIRAGQTCLISPFILAGAMSPVTIVGTLAQIMAEGMAGCALAQLLKPGAPIVFGCFSSSISMQSGAPTFGTPEPSLIIAGAAQLVRRLGLPFRSGGALCAAKTPDAQAMMESANMLNASVLAGVNFMPHAAGWLEGGLVMDYEKFILDVDLCGIMQNMMQAVDISENGQALDAIAEVGPGGHFLGCAHTQANFETAFYRSPTADNNSYEQWLADGEKDARQRANALWKKTLAEYEAPAMDEAVNEELRAYVTRRMAELPDSEY